MNESRRTSHAVGKPCPEKPWMLVTTLDWKKGYCGACGHSLYTKAGAGIGAAR